MMSEARPYFSDEEGEYEHSFVRVNNNLMEEYGLAKTWGCNEGNEEKKAGRRIDLIG